LELVYVLFGPDDFSVRQKLEEIKHTLGDKESLSLNTTELDGRRLVASQLIDSCSVAPFLANCRLVIVEGLLERFELSATATKRPLISEWQSLIDFLPTKPASTNLVLLDGKIAKNNPLLKKLAKTCELHEFLSLKGDSLAQWARERAATLNADMSPRAVKALIETAGEDLWVIANEIEKLSLFATGRRIEEADVRQVTSSAREASIFNMVDAIAEKRLPTAMRLLHRLLTEGTQPTHLLTMMSRQVRLMLEAKELSRQPRLSTQQKREQLGLSWNYPIDKLLSQSADHSKERLLEIYEKLLDTDMAIKTGKWQDELALDLLVVEVCSSPG
jgi:DNA polymerase-3 subunit delta